MRLDRGRPRKFKAERARWQNAPVTRGDEEDFMATRTRLFAAAISTAFFLFGCATHHPLEEAPTASAKPAVAEAPRPAALPKYAEKVEH